MRALEEAQQYGRYESELREVRKDGTEFWAHIVIEPLRDEHDNPIGFVRITRDISHRREMEERLRQSQKLEAIGQLTGGVAHDFNNHLMVIINSLDRARTSMHSDAKLAAAVELALRAAERAARLTTQLLAFARRQPLAPEATDIGRLVGEMADLLHRTLGETIRIETIRESGLSPAYCDASQLQGALLNIAVNARDAMPAGGTLTVEVGNAELDDEYVATSPDAAAGAYVMVAISDSGTGMSPEVMQRAYEPFFTTKPEGQGTGLGLSQVFGFIKQSSGHMKLYSEVEHGTTVKLYLPKATMATAEPPDHMPDLPKGNGQTILVVEDDDDVRGVVVSMIRELGYVVLETNGPDGALAVLADHPVALIFSDVVMPGSITSRELGQRARQLQPGIKVLFTSGYTQNASIHGGLLTDGVELVSKPYRLDQLARRIWSALADTGR